MKYFTARDVVSRWGVSEMHTRATANIAQWFLDSVMQGMRFPVRTVEVDEGSQFQAGFEEVCREKGIPPFVPAAAIPQTQWACGEMEPLDQALKRWEWVYPSPCEGCATPPGS